MPEEETPTPEDITVELRICPDKHGKIIVGTAGKGVNASSASTDDDGNVIVTVGLNPIGRNCAEETQTTEIPIIKTGKLPAYCDDEDWFWWEREVDHVDPFSEEEILEDLPTMHIINPECCKWRETSIKLYGPERCGWPYDHSHGCDFLKYDAGYDFGGVLGTHNTYQISRNALQTGQVSPGMLIKLWHRFSGIGWIQAGEAYYCTCCFTGGKVVAATGEGTVDAQYTVECEGVEITAIPYGMEIYEVGDWVNLVRDGDKCKDADRLAPCKDGCNASSDDTYRIPPMRYGEDGA